MAAQTYRLDMPILDEISGWLARKKIQVRYQERTRPTPLVACWHAPRVPVTIANEIPVVTGNE